jgi:hypothetical protein
LSSICLNLLDECGKHLLCFNHLQFDGAMGGSFQELHVFRQQKVVLQFAAEPIAMSKKRWNSPLLVLRPQPSAMFALIDEPALRICDTIPKISCFGKFAVSL